MPSKKAITPKTTGPQSTTESRASRLKSAAKELNKRLAKIDFSSVTQWVYNPLVYAWNAHEEYLDRFATESASNVFLGMNPGPWGMAQTGVPFGEVSVVRDWLKIQGSIRKPAKEHPKRPVVGLNCTRSEVSGARLWGLFRDRYETPERFFAESFVANYCPLVFMDESGKNLTPDKFPRAVREPMQAACDLHLQRILEIFEPANAIGVGNYAYVAWLRAAPVSAQTKMLKILHPSPASPASNRGWAPAVESTLREAGIW